MSNNIFAQIEQATWEQDDRDHTVKNRRQFKVQADPLALVVYWRKTNILETLMGTDMHYTYDMCRALEGNLFRITDDSYISELYKPDEESIAEAKQIRDKLYKPDEESIAEAKQIRDYYKSRLGFRAMMNERVGDFDKKLSEFLDQDRGYILEDQLGMVVKLPEMYQTDLVYDKLRDEYTSVAVKKKNKFHASSIGPTAMRLRYVTKTKHREKRRNYVMYWFSYDGKLYNLPVEANNYLRPFIEREIKKPEFDITGYVSVAHLHPNSDFWVFRIGSDFEVM
jgi:hypothetical protein